MTLPGFRALAVHRFGNWVQQRRWGAVRVVLRRIYTALFRYVRNHYRIELLVTASIGRRVVIGRHSGIVVHANAIIGDDCVLRQKVTLGAMTRERGEQAPTLGRGSSLTAVP
jgi:serine O-acetyltransferase